MFLGKRVVNNMQQIYRGTPVPKCNFNKVALQLRHGCSPVNFLSEHLFLWTPLKSCFYNSIKSSTIRNINSIWTFYRKFWKVFNVVFFSSEQLWNVASVCALLLKFDMNKDTLQNDLSFRSSRVINILFSKIVAAIQKILYQELILIVASLKLNAYGKFCGLFSEKRY